MASSQFDNQQQQQQQQIAGNSVFQDVNYLHAYPLISIPSVLSYFAMSPFYDDASNNQELIRQGNLQTAYLESLQTMTGLEYYVDEERSKPPRLFVINKQMRDSPTKFRVLQVYFCFDGCIMRAPDFVEMIRIRFGKIALSVLNSFETLQAEGMFE